MHTMNARTAAAAPTQTDVDMATYVAFTRNGRNRHATARELGIAPSTVTARVTRHMSHMPAGDAPGTAVAIVPVHMPADVPADDDVIDGVIVDDAPADDAPADDAPADDADAPRRAPRHTHCALCGFAFNRPRARAICRAVNACTRRVAVRAADADADADTIDAAVAMVHDTHAAYDAR